MENSSILIQLNSVVFGFSYHNPILDGITFSIFKNDFVGIVGPSGAGKTTLLKMICGLYKPWNGTINIGTGFTNKLNIGYVPQVEEIDWNFPITVMELVSLGGFQNKGSYLPWNKKSELKKIQDILDDLKISKLAKRQISDLSGGERQKVFLARTIIKKPDILILDEPTSGLDFQSKEQILGILFKLNEEGVAIILSTHDLLGVAKKLPKVICINKHIISQGPPDEIFSQDVLIQTYGIDNTIIKDQQE